MLVINAIVDALYRKTMSTNHTPTHQDRLMKKTGHKWEDLVEKAQPGICSHCDTRRGIRAATPLWEGWREQMLRELNELYTSEARRGYKLEPGWNMIQRGSKTG